jgi:hypothetical protein
MDPELRWSVQVGKGDVQVVFEMHRAGGRSRGQVLSPDGAQGDIRLNVAPPASVAECRAARRKILNQLFHDDELLPLL